MKKVLSIILLISMLMSMMLIVPVSAEESELPDGVTWSEPENVARIATVENLVNVKANNARCQFDRINDGILDNSVTKASKDASDNSKDTGLWLHYVDGVLVSQIQSKNERYDLSGNLAAKDATHKYLGYFDLNLTKVQKIDNIKVYLDALDVAGVTAAYKAEDGLMLQGFDLLISKDGKNWTTVYTVSKLTDQTANGEDKYLTRKNAGLNDSGELADQAWIDVKFATTEAQYVRFALTECRLDMSKNPASPTHRFRIAEIEVFSTPELELPKGAEWGDAENVSKNKASVVNPVNVKANNAKCPFTRMFDGILDNAVADELKAQYADSTGAGGLHYMDGVLISQIQGKNERYDLTGNKAAKDATHKYLGYFDIDLQKVQYIDNIKVYLDALDVGGVTAAYKAADGLLLQGFDLLVSENGSDWNTVYSVSKLTDQNADGTDKYSKRKNAGLNDSGDNAEQAWINVEFDITAARYVRFALTECRFDMSKNSPTHRFRIAEIEVFGRDVIMPPPPVEEEEVEEPAINSLMLFPLLMRHRQYETETTTTMFGLRVKHLLRSADSITFEKNGVKAVMSADALKALNLAGSDKLVVTIVDEQVTVTVNGKTVDVTEGITVTKA